MILLNKTNDEYVKIDSVIIDGLFSHFNYDITFNKDNNISIFTAPNGCGKTTVFSMIDFIFNPTIFKYRRFRDIDFKRLKIILSNGNMIVAEKKKKKSKNDTAIIIELPSNGETDSEELERYEIFITFENEKKKKFNITDIFEELDYQQRKSNFRPADNAQQVEEMLLQDLLEPRYINHSALRVIKSMDINEIHDYVLTLSEQIKPYMLLFIPAERFRNPVCKHYKKFLVGEVFPNKEFDDTIQVIDKSIKKHFQQVKIRYNYAVEEARNKLPSEYIHGKKKALTYKAFSEKWEEYQTKLQNFKDIGFIESADTIDVVDKNMYENKKEFLNAYLDVFMPTLEKLEKYFEQYKLFIDIFNERNIITHKKMKITNDGIKIFVNEKEMGDISMLSSGEKNDLIMFFYLIFEADNGQIILIDEPEISLHIEWQKDYINKLKQIAELGNLQVMIATHSPFIVEDHRELIVRNWLTDDWKD